MAVMGTVDRVEAELRDFARLQVYAGLLDASACRAELAAAIRAELPQQATNGDVLARAWLAKAVADQAEQARTWPTPTDTDRLDAALTECEEHEVLVFRGVEGPQVVAEELEQRTGLRGALWFTPSEVWHAVDHGELTLTLWSADGAPAVREEPLTGAVTSCLSRHGLRVLDRADGGGLRVACRWQRRR